MIRGFLTGVIWGGVVAGAGLAVISQVAPLPPSGSAEAPAEPVLEPSPAPLPKAPEAEVQPEILQKGPESDEAAPGDAAPEADAMDAPASGETQPEADAAAEAVMAQPQADAAADSMAEKQPVPEAPASEAVEPSVTEAPEASAQAVEPEAETSGEPPMVAATEEPAAPLQPDMQEMQAELPEALAENRPGLIVPDSPGLPGAETTPILNEPPPEAPVADDVLLRPDPAPAEETAPALIAPQDEPADIAAAPVLEPDTGLEESVPGVRTDRLPRIGDEEMEATEDEVPELAEVPLTGTTPLELFARAFENPEGKPLFSIILIDEGTAPEDRGNLAALPFPVTFAIDPLMPDSAEASRVYRQAGQEVAMLATGIPEGATAGDLEQSLQALDLALPEAVVVLDRPEGNLQEARDLARQIVPIVAEQGRGLVTYDRGLNPADQVARREGVPSAVIFRVLDSEGESIPKMRNYLDRAAFKAAQEGKVVVIGRAHPETVAAILQWTVEGRAATVALAPVSAVLEKTSSP